MHRRFTLRAALVSAVALLACGPGLTELSAGEAAPVVGEDETVSVVLGGLAESVAVGTLLNTTANLNLRTGPDRTFEVRLVMPKASTVSVVEAQPTERWYKVKYNGVVGWSSGAYLTAAKPPPSSTGREEAVKRAKSAVGFSYWWGSSVWLPNGLTSATAGSCTGSCPSCTHTGRFGADCSGYLAKIWQVPASNTDFGKNTHPYSTLDFIGSDPQWSTVSRAALIAGDALTYNIKGKGHIFLYESGDGWGSMWAYEAKGCSYGIVHNLRTASSSFKAIRRAGY